MGVLDRIFGDQEERDKKSAEGYFERLKGERLIDIPQDPRCEIAIVVPVSNEDPEAVRRLLNSLIEQRGVDPEQYEVLAVVNNRKDDGSIDFKQRREASQAVLDMPIWANRPAGDLSGRSDDERRKIEEIRKRVRFFAIDKSSSGNELAEGGVGRARNRGIAEAAFRFFKQGKNGILFQTDADARLPDPEFLKRTLDAFADKEVLGGTGGFYYEFPIETSDPVERAKLEKDRDDLVMLQTLKRLYQFDPREYKKGDAGAGLPGVNMMTRSYETAVLGGLEDMPAGEDTAFKSALRRFATARGRSLFKDDSLKIATALRESQRTPVLFKSFVAGESGGQKFIEDPLVMKELLRKKSGLNERRWANFAEFRSMFLKQHKAIPLEDAYAKMRAKVAETEEGREFLVDIDVSVRERFPWLADKKHE